MKRLTIARFSILIRNKYVMKSHITAVCGSFKSCLANETSSGESGIPHHGSVWFVQVLSSERDILRGIGNPTSRQCVVRSSPFQRTRHHPGQTQDHVRAVVAAV